jgi:aminoglycoside 6'-N-acetyltransferase I
MFLACDGEKAIGAAHCSIRGEYVEGTDGGDVGYLEGLYVLPDYRLKDVGRGLLEQCETWAANQGCAEFASDCEVDNGESYRFHLKTGFAEVSRNIHFVKRIWK